LGAKSGHVVLPEINALWPKRRRRFALPAQSITCADFDICACLAKEVYAVSPLMRPTLVPFLSLFVVLHSFAAPPPPAAPANARTIRNLPDFPLAALKVSLNPKLYKSLLISPVTAWVVAQAPTVTSPEPKIMRSDAGGAFDKLALALAKEWGSVGYNTTESRTHFPSLKVHLLIYKIADGLMAVNFAYDDEAFYQSAGMQHTDVWVGVYKNGQWRRIGGTKVIRNSPEPYR
jgi:hypothetical protein